MARSRTEWSDEARANVYVVWVANEGNNRRTARECGMHPSTITAWANKWKKDGPPEGLDAKITSKAYEFVSHASRIRESAMNKLEELIPEAKPSQLSAIATVVGILDDKIRLASGLATKRTETVHLLPSKEEMKELMSGFAEGLVSTATDRASETVLIDSEVIVN